MILLKGRERAEARAFERFFKNRVKQLGTLLPPSPEAPEPDTALLWSFLSRQLAEGITNEAEVLPRALVAGSGEATAGRGAGRSAAGGAAKAARRGVVISQPRPQPDARRTVPCPLPSWVPAATGPATAKGSGGVPPGQGQGQTTLVHIFWDVESAHPGDRDPRLVAAEVLRLAGRLGRVVGSYAYATRPAWAWVPSHFLDAYGQDADADEEDIRAGGSGDGEGDGGAADAAPLPAARVRCPVCGRQLTAPRLEGHIRALHPDRPAANLAAAALAEVEARAPGAAQANARAAAGRRSAAAAAAAAAASGRKAKGRTNSYRTGLGAVREYVSSSGEVFRPPAGHQLGLKYVLQREGFEPRVAQNADGASDRALNGGVDKLLAALRSAGRARADAAAAARGGALAAAAEAEVQYAVVLVSGSRRHGAALSGCRQLGVQTVVVAAGTGAGAGSSVLEEGQADAVLSWEVLAGGAYRI
ncbi:hypothetical protein PLESTF_001506700 [Pleodorina starrii]|nr:hypothetical protein PLESTF_001506700 [Pleodorina starrii]